MGYEFNEVKSTVTVLNKAYIDLIFFIRVIYYYYHLLFLYVRRSSLMALDRFSFNLERLLYCGGYIRTRVWVLKETLQPILLVVFTR